MKAGRIFPAIVRVAVLLTLSACSVLPEKTAVTVYQLPLRLTAAEPGSTGSGAQPVSNRVLRVNTPAASPTLNSDRILVSQAPYQVMAYQGIRWDDQVPRLMRNQLVQALTANGQWQAVITDSSTARASYQLGGELLDFMVYEVAGQREVSIRFDATLMDVDNNRIVAAHPFSVTQAVKGAGFDPVVEAFANANARLGAEVASWLTKRTTAR